MRSKLVILADHFCEMASLLFALELGKTRAGIQCLQGLKDIHCDGVH